MTAFSPGRRKQQASLAERKKAAPKGAAKFREETPRKGRGVTERKSVMPRCNNMAPHPFASKRKNIPNVKYFRQKNPGIPRQNEHLHKLWAAAALLLCDAKCYRYQFFGHIMTLAGFTRLSLRRNKRFAI
ncbi:MAG: hypothetical protein KGI68_04885 [Alphaproteobacteria bacterium]|nr:hypothetical protein [Alphaproteobacteria bacterium]MDE2164133.1 hypothetical protein [Alphaproteobacteria bacterium]MDE2264724.1 hypothetical protein [Alphaproteobacteria bacterium]